MQQDINAHLRIIVRDSEYRNQLSFINVQAHIDNWHQDTRVAALRRILAMLFDCVTNLADLLQLLLLVPCTRTSYKLCLHLHATGMLFLAFNFAPCPLHHLVFLGINFSVSAFRSLALYKLNVTVLSYPMQECSFVCRFPSFAQLSWHEQY